MFREKKIAFIGPGVMAEAMLKGLLSQGVADAEGVLVAGPRRERLEALQSRYQVAGYTDNVTAARLADVVVLSIKPQRLDDVLVQLKDVVRPNALVLSIVAGARIEKIAAGLGHTAIVRAMPNTPAQIGEGITVWTDSSGVSEVQRAMAAQILGAFGEEIYMEDEDYLDMATALSGTGPAYVFLFMEAMVDAGVHLGFPRRVAEKLVAQTLRGSVDYYLQHMDNGSSLHLAHLRNQVTSPGGTSAAALYYLEKAGFRTAISRAIWAAYQRSCDLGRGQKTQDPETPAQTA
ncbi:MAG: pyrroline-5-carboxylate reductase [Anaerolineales bacterium]